MNEQPTPPSAGGTPTPDELETIAQAFDETGLPTFARLTRSIAAASEALPNDSSTPRAEAHDANQAGEGELDTIDTLARDACTIGYYGPKSEYRKRLIAWAERIIGEDDAILDRMFEATYQRNKRRNKLRTEQRARLRGEQS